MNTGLLRYVVATVLTVYGIETNLPDEYKFRHLYELQQCLPFTVLKRAFLDSTTAFNSCNSAYRLRY